MLGERGKNQLLKRFNGFRGDRKDSFSTSLPYYLLTGRKGCKTYTDGQATVVVAVHPHDNKKILVFPEINGSGQLTVKILNDLAGKNANVRLARYTDADYQNLHQALADDRSNAISSIKIDPETILDWTYPAHILDTELVANREGNAFSSVRNKFNKVADTLEETPLSHPDALRKMRASIFIWAGLMINSGKETGHDMTGFYDKLVELIVDFPSMFDGFVISHKGEPAGFTIWEEAGDIANGLAKLPRYSIPGMSEYQDIRACEILNAKGVKRYHVGGSETKGLDNFKLKFRPVDSLDLNSYEVEFNTLDNQGVKEISLVDDQYGMLDFKI